MMITRPGDANKRVLHRCCSGKAVFRHEFKQPRDQIVKVAQLRNRRAGAQRRRPPSPDASGLEGASREVRHLQRMGAVEWRAPRHSTAGARREGLQPGIPLADAVSAHAPPTRGRSRAQASAGSHGGSCGLRVCMWRIEALSSAARRASAPSTRGARPHHGWRRAGCPSTARPVCTPLTTSPRGGSTGDRASPREAGTAACKRPTSGARASTSRLQNQ